MPLQLSRWHRVAHVFKGTSLRRRARPQTHPFHVPADHQIEAVCHLCAWWLGEAAQLTPPSETFWTGTVGARLAVRCLFDGCVCSPGSGAWRGSAGSDRAGEILWLSRGQTEGRWPEPRAWGRATGRCSRWTPGEPVSLLHRDRPPPQHGSLRDSQSPWRARIAVGHRHRLSTELRSGVGGLGPGGFALSAVGAWRSPRLRLPQLFRLYNGIMMRPTGCSHNGGRSLSTTYPNSSWFTRAIGFCVFMVPVRGHIQVLGLCPSSRESLVLLAPSRVSASALWSTPEQGPVWGSADRTVSLGSAPKVMAGDVGAATQVLPSLLRKQDIRKGPAEVPAQARDPCPEGGGRGRHGSLRDVFSGTRGDEKRAARRSRLAPRGVPGRRSARALRLSPNSVQRRVGAADRRWPDG